MRVGIMVGSRRVWVGCLVDVEVCEAEEVNDVDWVIVALPSGEEESMSLVGLRAGWQAKSKKSKVINEILCLFIVTTLDKNTICYFMANTELYRPIAG
jgi:hypothetical protein